MKKLLSILLIGILMSFSWPVQAQEEYPDTEYFQNLEAYYTSLADEDSTQQKALARVTAKMVNKLDANRSLIAYNQATSNICGNICTDPDLASWNYLGPATYHNGPANAIQWNGFVGVVNADPSQVASGTPEQNLLMGTPTAGAWSYDINSSGWGNKTDPLGNPGLGISNILRDAYNSQYLIASTGMRNESDYGNGLGLIYSSNNGNDWLPLLNASSYPADIDLCNTNITGLYADYDFTGNQQSLTASFFITIRRNGAQDELLQWCAGLGFINRASFGQPIEDFTANNDGSFLLTTYNPWGFGCVLYRGVETADCQVINWTDITTNLQNAVGGTFDPSRNQRISVSNSKGLTVFARTKGDQGNELYRSSDGGLTWIRRTSASILKDSKLMLEYSPVSQLVYLGGTSMHVWDDAAGTLHTYSNMHADVRMYSLAGINNAGQEICYVANDGGVSEIIYDPTLGAGNLIIRPISGNSMSIQQVWGIGITQSCQMDYAIGQMHNNSMASVGGVECKFGAGDGGDIEINPVDNSTVYYSINPYIYTKQLSDLCNPGFGTLVAQTSQWNFGYDLVLHPSSPCLLFFGDDVAKHVPANLRVHNNCGGIPVNTPQVLTNVSGNNPGEYMEKIGAIAFTEAAPTQVFLGHKGGTSPNLTGKLLKNDDYGTDTWQDLSLNMVTTYGQTLIDATGWLPIGDIVVSPYDKDLLFLSFQGTATGKRVLRSTNGGQTFEEYSTGLPIVPVNALKYYYNSDDLLFAMTDAGVYYRDANMLSWECFNENLPLVWCTEGEINYCKDELIVTTHGRGVHKTSLANLPNRSRSHNITGNEVWRRDRVLYSSVTVKTGAKLSIIDALVKLAGEVRIIVEPGASLEIIDSELTSLCEDQCWDGVFVEGDSDMPQTPLNQGRATISGSTFSHAKSAINALGLLPDNSNDWSAMGGILQLRDNRFINNRRAIQFLAYDDGSTANVSFIIDCSFLINDQYRDNCGSNSPFITLFGVNGLSIQGCSFTDNRASLTTPEDYRGGIGCSESTFLIGSSGSQQTSFTHLYRAIDASMVSEDNLFELVVEDAYFEDNETAIRLDNFNNESRILRNDIYLGHPLAASAYGIVLHNSSGFQVEENYCRRGAGSSFVRAFDILNTYNSGNPWNNPYFANHIIYNNIVQNSSEGFTAWGDNVASNNVDGLAFLCNQNINNNIDFHFINCVKPTQGSPSQAAGNTFSCGSSTAFVIDAGAINCVTYYQEGTAPCSSFSYPDINIQFNGGTPVCSYLTSSSELVSTILRPIIYPNPTQSSLMLRFEEITKLSGLYLYDLSGRELLQWEVSTTVSTHYELNLASLAAGIYLLRGVTDDGSSFIQKVVKK